MKSRKCKQGISWFGYVVILLVPLCVGIFSGESIMATDSISYTSIANVPIYDWKTLADKKIFFGHHSVGNNIIQGLVDIQKSYPEIKLNIIRTHDPAQFNAPIFAHSAVGKNTDPLSKIKEFDEFIRNGIGTQANIVFFKFCFVDVVRKTDIQKLFRQYKAVVEQIQHDYPELRVLHCTVPLQVHTLNWKSYIKNSMNFTSWKYTDNVKRNEFNAKLLDEYGKSGTVFNLALFEATSQDGSIVRFTGPGGKKYLALNPAYASDGAHLNESGSRFVAEHLLLFLLNVR